MGISRVYVFNGWCYPSTLLISVPMKANVLIDQAGHARLADFALASIISDFADISSPGSPSMEVVGARWMSPELMDPEQFGVADNRPIISSDCYALGMVIFETISGHLPFPRHQGLVIFLNVMSGKRPPREVQFTDNVWEMLERCWGAEPDARPSIEEVLQCLEMEPPSAGTDVEMEENGADDGTEEDSDDWYSADDSCKFSQFSLLKDSWPV